MYTQNQNCPATKNTDRNRVTARDYYRNSGKLIAGSISKILNVRHTLPYCLGHLTGIVEKLRHVDVYILAFQLKFKYKLCYFKWTILSRAVFLQYCKTTMLQPCKCCFFYNSYDIFVRQYFRKTVTHCIRKYSSV